MIDDEKINEIMKILNPFNIAKLYTTMQSDDFAYLMLRERFFQEENDLVESFLAPQEQYQNTIIFC